MKVASLLSVPTNLLELFLCLPVPSPGLDSFGCIHAQEKQPKLFLTRSCDYSQTVVHSSCYRISMLLNHYAGQYA